MAYKKKKDSLLTSESWRVFKIISEFVNGFETMYDLGPSVAIFGSNRLPKTNPYHKIATEVAKKIVRKKFAIVTGGGFGIMQAANKGAQQANGKSCGLDIELPFTAPHNRYIDPEYHLTFHYFFIRKVMFIRYTQGYVFFPGGFGTCDELFEVLTLIQTKKIHPYPVFLIGKEYWKGLFDWLKNSVLKEKCISDEDFSFFKITDDLDEVAEGIEQYYLKYQKPNTL